MQPPDTRASLEAKTITELRRMSRGVVKGGYDMKKADLIDALIAVNETTVPDPRRFAIRDSKTIDGAEEQQKGGRRQRRKSTRAKRTERFLVQDDEGVQSTVVKSHTHTQRSHAARRNDNRRRNKAARRSRKANR